MDSIDLEDMDAMVDEEAAIYEELEREEMDRHGDFVNDDETEEEDQGGVNHNAVDNAREAVEDEALRAAACARYNRPDSPESEEEEEDNDDVSGEDSERPRGSGALNTRLQQTERHVRSMVEINPSVSFDREVQPYGTTDEMMQLASDDLVQIVQCLYDRFGGKEFGNYTMTQVFEATQTLYPYDSPVHLFTLHRTYIGQLGGVMAACRHRNMLDTRHSENRRTLHQLLQVHTYTHI
jgi:hypothetical protein